MNLRMRLAALHIALVLFITPYIISAAEIYTDKHNAVRAIVKNLSNNLPEGELNITIDTLTLEKTGISSSFAEEWLILLYGEMKQPQYQQDFKTVDRQSATRNMVRTRGGFKRIEENDVTANTRPVSVGSKEVLLSGTYRLSADKKAVIVSMRLEKANGAVISRAETAISRSSIKEELEPKNKANFQQTVKEIDTDSKPARDFEIYLWVDKGNGGVYRSGQEMELMFRSDTACYLKVLYIDVNGNRIVMYPTARDAKTRLSAHVLHKLHTNNKYTILSPFGSEMIIAFASTEPFNEQDEINLGGGFRGYAPEQQTKHVVKNLRKRGLSVGAQSRKAKISEAQVYITTTNN
jgi:hypothetical protein